MYLLASYLQVLFINYIVFKMIVSTPGLEHKPLKYFLSMTRTSLIQANTFLYN